MAKCGTEEMMQSGNQFNRTFYYEYGTCKMVKTGLQKDNHVCDVLLNRWEPSKLKKEHSYKKWNMYIFWFAALFMINENVISK